MASSSAPSAPPRESPPVSQAWRDDVEKAQGVFRLRWLGFVAFRVSRAGQVLEAKWRGFGDVEEIGIEADELRVVMDGKRGNEQIE